MCLNPEEEVNFKLMGVALLAGASFLLFSFPKYVINWVISSFQHDIFKFFLLTLARRLTSSAVCTKSTIEW